MRFLNNFSFVLLSVLTLALLLVSHRSYAANATADLRSGVDSDVVGVGDTFELTLSAMITGGVMPEDPLPGTISGFRVERPRVATSRTMSIVNGQRSDGIGLNVSWTLHATRIGTFTIGPPSVVVAGKRVSARAVTVRVVPAGHAPAHNQNPFADPFGSGGPDPLQALLGGMGMIDEPQQQAQPQFVTDPTWALDAPRGRTAFLHATLDKTQAVVGEQVTLTVALYVDATQREPPVNDVHEATATDFLKRTLREDDSVTEPAGNALVGGQPWVVKIVRRSALFPLRTGDLEIGPMSLSIVRGGNSSGAPRESEVLHVHVTEPPMAGRPPGYAVGDVGHFALNVEVTPKNVERDGAVGVDVDLTGSGNLPAALPLPTKPGVEWLAPEIREKLGPLEGGRFGGSRHFSYVVRLHNQGQVDLGEIALPYWDADAHAYAFARAKLGAVDVAPGTNAQKDGGTDDLQVLAGLPPPVTTLAGAPEARQHRTDRPIFWIGLFGAPLVVVAASGATSLARRIRARGAEQAASPKAEWKEKVALADKAIRDADPNGDAAVLRALHAAPLAFFGVSIRGARDEDEVTQILEEAGVPAARAEAYADLVHACETDRYAPEPASIETIRARWVEAKRLMNGLNA